MGGGGGGKFSCNPKSLNFPFLLDKNITSLLPFRQVLIKILPVGCIQLDKYDFEKARLKLSLLIQNSVQQDYLPESYARYLHS